MTAVPLLLSLLAAAPETGAPGTSPYLTGDAVREGPSVSAQGARLSLRLTLFSANGLAVTVGPELGYLRGTLPRDTRVGERLPLLFGALESAVARRWDEHGPRFVPGIRFSLGFAGRE